MRADRALRDAELTGETVVGPAAGQQRQDLRLAPRQCGEVGLSAAVLPLVPRV